MKKNYILGIIIILIGIIFLGNNLDIWNINILFKGWWTLFIIIPSIKGLIEKEYITSLLGLSIGILLLLSSQKIISWSMVGEIFIPIVIIVLGLSFIINPKKKVTNNNKDIYFGIFSSTEEKILNLDKDITCIAIFGGIDLDLSSAKIKDNIKIECVSIFGGIDLHIPKNVSVKSNGMPILGGFENKCSSEKCDKNINVEYISIFAGVSVL